MIKRTIRGALHALGLDLVRWTPPAPAISPEHFSPTEPLSHRELVGVLRTFPRFQDKMAVFARVKCAPEQGAWVGQGGAARAPAALLSHAGKVQYGCGSNFLEGWLNLDLTIEERPGYAYANLIERHPIADNSVRFGFSEDMLEHVPQAQSIFVLSEMYRSLAPGGVLRLSFPSLEGVLLKHYSPPTAENLLRGEVEAYEFWDHIHFYSRDELRLVALHLGFRDIKFCEYGASEHPELRGLETRDGQIGLNLYVEMTK